MTILDAVIKCRETGLIGWDLTLYAQKLVSNQMKYSYGNSFDMPRRAFKRGIGYCWHQSSSLNMILNQLGLESKLVYAAKNLFPGKVVEGISIPPCTSGHVWCRVRIDGVEKDVCPGNAGNTPGNVHFTPVSDIKEWNAWIAFWSYWGSAAVNLKRLMAFHRLRRQTAQRNPR